MEAPEAIAQAALSRAERIDFLVSRHLPNASRRLNLIAYRLSGGRIGGAKRGVPIGLLSVRGRRSGEIRTVPLMYLPDGERALVVASNSGFDRPPAWYLNVTAAKVAKWRTRGGMSSVQARTLAPEEQAAIWGRMVEHNKLWGEFQDCTARRTAVVALEKH